MKTRVLRGIALVVLAALTLGATAAFADVNVTVSSADPYLGYMNVFELPSNGGGFLWGSGWGTADLCAVFFPGDQLKLSPNCIGDPNSYWYTPSGQPGCTGNKVMEANMYVEQTGPWAGQTINFTGSVLSNTLTSAHVAKIFIRDFAPDFSSVVEQSIPVPTSGDFSLSLATINDPARHVQYGYQMKGPDVWVTDLDPFGYVLLGPTLPTASQNTSWGKIKNLYR